MRGVLLIVLAGCVPLTRDPGDLGAPVDVCHDDSACGSSEVCARTSRCYPASEIREVHVTWTLSGIAASDASCSATPDLLIEFRGSRPTERLSFEPVPCAAGKFSIDKLPVSYTSVWLGGASRSGRTSMLDSVSGAAAIDLPY